MTKRLRQSYEMDPWDEGLMGDWKVLDTSREKDVEWACHGNSPLISGTFQERIIREGICVHWSDLHLGADVWMPMEESSWIVFEFTLTGAWENHVKSNSRRNYGEIAGQMGLLHERWESRHHWIASDSFVHVTAAMEEKILREWLGEPCEGESTGLQRVRWFLNQNHVAALHVPVTHHATTLVRQMMHCPYRGLMRSLCLEARFYDLVLEVIRALDDEPVSDFMGSRCHVQDQQLIRHAAELLTASLDAPPNLSELARLVGMSESKLNRGFRSVYGTTPFAYLRSRRMDRARQMLERGQVTVLEASASVGYENPSNFSAAFRACYGMNPREFLGHLKDRR